jgi:hypothetical protein
MRLSDCCQSPPQTILNEEGLSFCSTCGNWIKFALYGEDDELDDYAKLEIKFEHFRNRVCEIMEFYANPSNYIVALGKGVSVIEMDKGKNAQDMIRAIEEADNADINRMESGGA